jgi:hypothetical protein
VIAYGRGEQPVTDENDERRSHENGAQHAPI